MTPKIRPAILAASIAALLGAWSSTPTHASLLLDPTGGTVLFDSTATHDDESSNGRALGFTGTYFGTTHTTVDVSTNGFFSFTGNTTFSNSPLPTGVARIAPLWNDLYITSGNGPTITETVQPGILYAATWNSIEDINDSTVRQTFQAVWFGGAKVIHGFTFKLDDLVFSYQGPVGAILDGSATVGLDKGDGATFVPLPGTTDGLIPTATTNLLPAAANGGFVLFRPDGAGSYTAFLAAPVLQNSGTAGTPVDANFIVVDDVTTGDPTQSNTIGSVLFAEGASLRVFNTLTVTHNYTQSPTGTLKLSLSGTTTFDKVIVGGVAALDGALEVSFARGFKPKRGQTFAVLTAAGGVTGEFSEIISPDSTGLLGLGAIYESNTVLLTLVQQSFETVVKAFGGTPNQVATAQALDSVAFDKNPPAVIDYLDSKPINDLPGELDRIAPEELTAVFNIATSLANVQMTNLQRRLEDVRAGSAGFSAQRFAMQGSTPDYQGGFGLAGVSGPDGKRGPDGKTSKTVMLPEPPRWGFFINGSGEFTDVENDGNAHGFELTTGGITLGIDYRVCSNFAVGFTVGYAHTGADLTDQGYIAVDGGRVGLYATAFGNGFYLDTAVTGGWNGYDSRRTALQGSARGSTNGGELDVFVGGGYDWKSGALTVGPTANFQYTYMDLGGFTERGSLAPLTVANQNAESMRTSVGLKLSCDWKWHGLLIRPEVRAAWQHEFGDTAYTLVSHLAHTGGSSFTVAGPDIGRDSALVGAGFAVQCSERVSTYLYYDGEFGRSNYDSYSVTGGFRISF